jgi:ribosomal protein S1
VCGVDYSRGLATKTRRHKEKINVSCSLSIVEIIKMLLVMNELKELTWEQVKAKYQVGEYIEGVVVSKKPFGDFISIGLEFNILLEIIHIKDLTPEIYRTGNYNPLGTKVGGWILGFADDNQQIRISQKEN